MLPAVFDYLMPDFQPIYLIQPRYWTKRVHLNWYLGVSLDVRLERGSRQCCDPATHGM